MADEKFVQRVFSVLVSALQGGDKVDERPEPTKDPFHLVVRAMEEAEKFYMLSGTEKYEVVRETLQRLLDTHPELLPPTLSDFLKFAFEHRLLASLVTTIVEAAENSFDINRRVRAARNCWKDAFPCCFPPGGDDASSKK